MASLWSLRRKFYMSSLGFFDKQAVLQCSSETMLTRLFLIGHEQAQEERKPDYSFFLFSFQF